MNLNDQLHFYSIFNLTPFPLKLRNEISLVHGGNGRDSGVDELQRHLAVATTNIGRLAAYIDVDPVSGSLRMKLKVTPAEEQTKLI